MITVFVGHRGSGKSSLLRRIEKYFADKESKVLGIDLDRLIEKGECKTIDKLFSELGEDGFRIMEQKYFDEMYKKFRDKKSGIYISVGAGFAGEIPEDVMCVWVRRPTDTIGRVFLDRPRLSSEMSPLEEYQSRFQKRQLQYRDLCEEVYTIPEGLELPHYRENLLFTDGLECVEGILTVLPEFLKDKQRANRFLKKRGKWGVNYFELRDDILSPDFIKLAADLIDDDKILFSFRESMDSSWRKYAADHRILYDWAFELGECPMGDPPILSLHNRQDGEKLGECIRKLEAEAGAETHRKLAVGIHSFDELWQGHEWQRGDEKKRSFLPVSADGRWKWYRLLSRGFNKLNFLREGDSAHQDQPYLMDWLATAPFGINFGAVIGSPILHSRSPLELELFFAERGLSIFPVKMSEDEFDKGIKVLERLGLSHAAVTSPLKKKAFSICQWRSPSAEKFESVNTLVWDRGAEAWKGENTDVYGVKELLKDTISKQIAVWGGGGVLPAIKDVQPQCISFSSRTGELREGEVVPDDFSPTVVIWAVSRSQFKEKGVWPPAEWKPQIIIDINYTEDSPGREYAIRSGGEYKSGLSMFQKQAEWQKEFWRLNDD